MREYRRFYIDGGWMAPAAGRSFEVVNPATEAVVAVISMGDRTDVDRAVAAARRSFDAWSRTSREERIAVLGRIVDACKRRLDDLAQAITEEMGAPLATVSRPMQAPSAIGHFKVAMEVLEKFEFERTRGSTGIVREPIGVVGMITPWNWPANQIACKVAPALAAGCTIVLKPSEMAPLSALVIAEIIHEAGVPKGVFNLINGDGPTVGAALAAHPGIDMISFTGSTRAGILVDKAAADTVKKVALELGGKSPNILLDDADFGKAVGHGVATMMLNTGQSCNAPSRMLVPSLRLKEVEQVALAALDRVRVGDPLDPASTMGPQANGAQWRRVQAHIETGIKEGARVIAGGPGRPEGLGQGFYTRPTIFSGVTNNMSVAREEIFGPVLCILPYTDEEEAIRIANDTPYGLSSYVSSGDLEHARAVARRIRAGNVHLNGQGLDTAAPFGGYKQSGLGREWGEFGLEEYLEVKAVMGYA